MTSHTHTHTYSSDTVFASGAASGRKEAHTGSGAQVRSYFERWNRMEDAKAELAEDLKELFAEAKSNGHHPKALRIAFREERRAGDVPSADEMEVAALVEMYRAHIGLTYAQARDAREASPKSEPASGYLTSAEDGRGNPLPDQASGRSNPVGAKGEEHEFDSREYGGRKSGQQRDEARIQSSVGDREGGDESPEGQGPGIPPVDRGEWELTRAVDRQDENGRSCDVGGETHHEISTLGSASAAAPVDANSGARQDKPAPALSSDDLEIPEYLRRTPKENSVPA